MIFRNYIDKEVVVEPKLETVGGTFIATLRKYEKPFLEFSDVTGLTTEQGDDSTLFMEGRTRKSKIYHEDSLSTFCLASELEEAGELSRDERYMEVGESD